MRPLAFQGSPAELSNEAGDCRRGQGYVGLPERLGSIDSWARHNTWGGGGKLTRADRYARYSRVQRKAEGMR